MILLWALSPLGGQSALRLLHVAPRLAFASATVRYLPIIAASSMTAMVGASMVSTGWPSYASIYVTALTSSRRQKNSTQDLFGNVRIPSIDSLRPNISAGNESFITVDYNQEVSYSSLLGIPVVGIPVSGNISFNIVSRYLAIDCETAIRIANSTSFQNSADREGAGYVRYSQGDNFLVQAARRPPNPAQPIASFNMTSPNNIEPEDVSFVNCTMAPRDVESSVFCRDQSCGVIAMRNLTVDADLWWDTDFPWITFSILLHP